ncbi:penicillin-binding protein 2 [Cyanobium sp. NS01]|uniref:peptidoglycan D,D-transpeptidase FtsI family protein n=1 Tax=Cyanobium sp. NS01 TaxID=261284 RepID=UPI0016449FE2|nr:penicillin-binding protein 2 [Cyanobium sp. NS01]QNI70776.1 cell division protein FtsI (peptidoglycan synthetase) [Cyanobium sp. NS01]
MAQQAPPHTPRLPRTARPGRPGRSERVVAMQPLPTHRLLLVYGLLATALVGLGARLAWLQVIDTQNLQNRARAIQTQSVAPLGKRRTIVDRNGRLVALDEQRFTLWAHPRYFNFPGDDPQKLRRPDEVASRLGAVLAQPSETLLQRMAGRPSGVKLGTDIDPETADRIRRLNISGIDLEAYPQRVYPQGSLFANLVGFLNLERVPQAGLEQSRNSDLQRNETTLRMRRGADGTPLPEGMAAGSLYGDDLRLQLTLDARLQQVTQKALHDQVKKWKAKRGAALVMDVRNGEMLALASVPTYDPNRFWSFNPGLFREWSVQDLYEPGSTFKPINLALALQEKAIQADGKVFDNGSLSIGGWPIFNHNRQGNGLIDFPTVLEASSNVAMVKAMGKVKRERFWQWLSTIGIDERPDTDLPGAVAGELKDRKTFISHPIEPAVAAFGQGFSLTPLKLAQLHAMLANGGRLVSPHITRGLRSGDALAPAPGGGGLQVLDPEVTKVVMGWMETVVANSKSLGIHIPGYRIGGKTGTAQKAERGMYIPGALITSFVGHLPIDDPRYVVLVVVDEPKGGNTYGSTVAAPVARKIIDALLVLEQLPPSDPKALGASRSKAANPSAG